MPVLTICLVKLHLQRTRADEHYFVPQQHPALYMTTYVCFLNLMEDITMC